MKFTQRGRGIVRAIAVILSLALPAMLAVSISLCWGFGGILNLGQGIAFGLAAYGMGMTMQMQSQDPVSNPMPPFMLE